MSNLTVNAINGVDVQNIAKQTARAWVNFNGTGVVAIRKAYNVASITDNGVGDYTVNFSVPMPDINYAAIATVGSTIAKSGGGGWVAQTYTKTVSAARFNTVGGVTTWAAADFETAQAIFFD